MGSGGTAANREKSNGQDRIMGSMGTMGTMGMMGIMGILGTMDIMTS